MAQVAMSHGLNANLVHKWRRLAADDGEVRSAPVFVPVSVVAEVWPMSGAMACAAWLREMLR